MCCVYCAPDLDILDVLEHLGGRSFTVGRRRSTPQRLDIDAEMVDACGTARHLFDAELTAWRYRYHAVLDVPRRPRRHTGRWFAIRIARSAHGWAPGQVRLAPRARSVGACGGRLAVQDRDDLAPELGAQLLDQLGVRDRAAIGRKALAIEDLLPVQQHFERPAHTTGRNRDGYFALASASDFSRQTDGLPEVPSTDAIADFELGLTFCHVRPPCGGTACVEWQLPVYQYTVNGLCHILSVRAGWHVGCTARGASCQSRG